MKTFLKLKTILLRSTKSKSAHYNDVNAGLFTPPVKTGERSVAWPSDEVESIINAQIAGKTPEEIKLLVKVLIEKRKEAASTVDAQIAGITPEQAKQIAKAPIKKQFNSGVV